MIYAPREDDDRGYLHPADQKIDLDYGQELTAFENNLSAIINSQSASPHPNLTEGFLANLTQYLLARLWVNHEKTTVLRILDTLSRLVNKKDESYSIEHLNKGAVLRIIDLIRTMIQESEGDEWKLTLFEDVQKAADVSHSVDTNLKKTEKKKWSYKRRLGCFLASVLLISGIAVSPSVYHFVSYLLGEDIKALEIGEDLQQTIIGGNTSQQSNWFDSQNGIVLTEEYPDFEPTTPASIESAPVATVIPSQTIPESTPYPFGETTPEQTSPDQTQTEAAEESEGSDPSHAETEMATMPENNFEDTNFLEWLTQDVYNAVLEKRKVEFGLSKLDTPPQGYREIYDADLQLYYYVPEDTRPDDEWLYHPLTRLESLGLRVNEETVSRADIEKVIDNGRITFFLAGLDYRESYFGDTGFIGRTDAPVIVSMDVQTGEVLITRVARDTFSPEVQQLTGNSRNDSEFSVISWVHLENGKLVPNDVAFSRYVAENVMGIPIDAVWQFDFATVETLLDTLFPQGMPFYFEEELSDDAEEDVTFHFEAGWHNIDGQTAVALMRSRKTSSDEARSERQGVIVSTLIKNLISQIGKEFLNDPTSIRNPLSKPLGNVFEVLQAALNNNQASGAHLHALGLKPEELFSVMEELESAATSSEGLAALAWFASQGDIQDTVAHVQGGISFMQIGQADVTPGDYDSPTENWAKTRTAVRTYLQDNAVTETDDPVAAITDAPAETDSSLSETDGTDVIPLENHYLPVSLQEFQALSVTEKRDILESLQVFISDTPFNFADFDIIIKIGDSRLNSQAIWTDIDGVLKDSARRNSQSTKNGLTTQALIEQNLLGQELNSFTENLDNACAFIWFGANDINSGISEEAFIENHQRMVSLLEARGIQPVIVIAPSHVYDDREAAYLDYMSALTEFAAENNIPVINVFGQLAHRSDYGLGPDGVHFDITAENDIAEMLSHLLSNETDTVNNPLTWSEGESFDVFLENNFDTSGLNLNSETLGFIRKYVNELEEVLVPGSVSDEQQRAIQTALECLKMIGGTFHSSDRTPLEQSMLDFYYGNALVTSINTDAQ